MIYVEGDGDIMNNAGINANQHYNITSYYLLYIYIFTEQTIWYNMYIRIYVYVNTHIYIYI